MIIGIDLSENNGEIKWGEFHASQIKFAFIKATESIEIIDQKFENIRKGFQEKKILVGAYHWLNPSLHVGRQVENYLKAVGNFSGLLPPVVCVQNYQGDDKEDMDKSVQSFLVLIERAVGVKPIVYTSKKFWENNFPVSIWGCDYRLWLDWPQAVWPDQLWPWAGWTFWQYDFRKNIPGILTKVGLNYFNGDYSELKQMVVR